MGFARLAANSGSAQLGHVILLVFTTTNQYAKYWEQPTVVSFKMLKKKISVRTHVHYIAHKRKNVYLFVEKVNHSRKGTIARLVV